MGHTSGTAVTRRNLLAGMGLATATLGLGASAAKAEPDAPVFDEEYDVVVVGFGFAGATAAVYAGDTGAKVLMVDAAPAGHEGGNSRYCAQVAVYSTDKESMKTCYRGLGWLMDQDDEVLDAFAEGLGETYDIAKHLGADEAIIWSEYLASEEGSDPENKTARVIRGLRDYGTPEFPELPGSDAIDGVTAHAGIRDAVFYGIANEAANAHENVTVWLESPARHLIQDASGRVTGVTVQHEGADVRVKAARGVVLACGGFECNRQMIQDYLGCPRLAPLGGLYNNGDGIRMTMEVGADLWHMHVYESIGMLGGNHVEVPDGERVIYVTSSKFLNAASGSFICIAEDGSRFFREDQVERHGHLYQHGIWRVPNTSNRPHLVFGEAQKTTFEEAGFMPENMGELLVSAATAEELAALIDADPAILSRTVERFNTYAAQGEDIEFDRAPETMAPFEGTLYALPLQPTVLNTQGGPRRNARAQVVGLDGNPIEGLFSAGECGGICAFSYQGGSNVAECLVFGKIAGTNAALGV